MVKNIFSGNGKKKPKNNLGSEKSLYLRRAFIFGSMPISRLIGIPGRKRPLRKPKKNINPFFSPSDIRPVTGVMLWLTSLLMTRQ